MKSEISNKPAKDAAKKSPEWANGLRQLYNSVVDEPLPDSFKDLLSQLDDPSQSGGDERA
ncbi:MAG: NepR family anti-sigma factor [Pontixanthobacter sp.]